MRTSKWLTTAVEMLTYHLILSRHNIGIVVCEYAPAGYVGACTASLGIAIELCVDGYHTVDVINALRA